jgi:hypothetical protein
MDSKLGASLRSHGQKIRVSMWSYAHSYAELARYESERVGHVVMGVREIAMSMLEYLLRSLGMPRERARMIVSEKRGEQMSAEALDQCSPRFCSRSEPAQVRCGRPTMQIRSSGYADQRAVFNFESAAATQLARWSTLRSAQSALSVRLRDSASAVPIFSRAT